MRDPSESITAEMLNGLFAELRVTELMGCCPFCEGKETLWDPVMKDEVPCICTNTALPTCGET